MEDMHKGKKRSPDASTKQLKWERMSVPEINDLHIENLTGNDTTVCVCVWGKGEVVPVL
jgi:hypothetical protein